jgi:hypothetical protein
LLSQVEFATGGACQSLVMSFTIRSILRFGIARIAGANAESNTHSRLKIACEIAITETANGAANGAAAGGPVRDTKEHLSRPLPMTHLLEVCRSRKHLAWTRSYRRFNEYVTNAVLRRSAKVVEPEESGVLAAITTPACLEQAMWLR